MSDRNSYRQNTSWLKYNSYNLIQFVLVLINLSVVSQTDLDCDNLNFFI